MLSEPRSSHPLIPPEIDAEMAPAVGAFVGALIDSFQDQIALLHLHIADFPS